MAKIDDPLMHLFLNLSPLSPMSWPLSLTPSQLGFNLSKRYSLIMRLFQYPTSIIWGGGFHLKELKKNSSVTPQKTYTDRNMDAPNIFARGSFQFRVQQDHSFFFRPRLVLIWKFCQDQDQYMILTSQVLKFEIKTKSLAELISSLRPLILF